MTIPFVLLSKMDLFDEKQFSYRLLNIGFISNIDEIDTAADPLTLAVFSVPNGLASQGPGFMHQLAIEFRYFDP
jgi:hypothetical protein